MISRGFIFSKICVVFSKEIEDMPPLKSIMTSAFPAKFFLLHLFFLVPMLKQLSGQVYLYMADYYFNGYNYRGLKDTNWALDKRSIVKKVLRC